MADPEQVHYDEFSLFHENIDEFDLRVDTIPQVARFDTTVADQRSVSALRWGTAPPELVLVHGGSQNAHTWDTVVLALGRPALAIDLPGHGHSAWRPDGGYTPANMADDLAVVIAEHAADARTVVGMSLGGLTAMMLAERHPQLVRSLVLVDITPGVNGEKAKSIIDFVNGPQVFDSFDDLVARTIEFNPTRSVSSLRRGILHNAHPLPDGSWQWNYDRTNRHGDGAAEMPSLWDVFGSVRCPVTLVRGSLSPVVDDDDVTEARRRQPDIDVVMIDGAGHSVQGDRPVELAGVLAARLDAGSA